MPLSTSSLLTWRPRYIRIRASLPTWFNPQTAEYANQCGQAQNSRVGLSCRATQVRTGKHAKRNCTHAAEVFALFIIRKKIDLVDWLLQWHQNMMCHSCCASLESNCAFIPCIATIPLGRTSLNTFNASRQVIFWESSLVQSFWKDQLWFYYINWILLENCSYYIYLKYY